MTTPNLALASMDANMLQPSFAFNAAMRDLDALVFMAIVTTTNTPPTTTAPADVGKRWIVGASPTGPWSGQSKNIALCVGANLWRFLIPKEGWTARDVTTDLRWEYSGSAWAVQNFAAGAEFAGSITGLVMSRNSGTSLTVSTGAAHIESTGRVLAVTTAITKSSLSLSNNTTYHLYLYSNSGTPDVEVVTTAPAAAYSGKARSKTGDTTRRYIGSVRTNGSGQVREFVHDGDSIRYQETVTAAPYRVLGPGTATSWTAIALSALVPATSKAAIMDIQVVGGSVGTDIASKAAGAGFSTTINPSQRTAAAFPIDSSQNFYYKAPLAGAGALYVDVWGYTFER